MRALGYKTKAACIGALLALGAPLGYILYSFLLLNPERIVFIEWCQNIWVHERELLTYLTFPTMLVFSAFGYYQGLQESKLYFKTHQMAHFLGIAVHDIRAPLTVMVEAANMMCDKLAGPITEKQEKYLNIIGRQGSTMSELITEILDIQKMEAGQYDLELKESDLGALVQKAISEMEPMLEKKAGKIAFKPGTAGKVRVFLDPFRIRQVIRNIIGNAIKYIPEQGTIHLSISKDDAGCAALDIANDGPHIPDEKLKTIFDKFTQATIRDYKLGHGLGLAICKNIIDLHAGRIWVENVVSGGVCFHIRFPAKICPP